MSKTLIEVYEWEAGEPRPGTVTKSGCIDLLEIPPNGQIPQKDDILLIHIPGSRGQFELVRFRVIERELLWFSRDKGASSQDPLPWLKLWLHVRRLEDETK